MFSSLKCDGNVHVNTLAGLTPFNLTIYSAPPGFLNTYVNIISRKFYLMRERGPVFAPPHSLWSHGSPQKVEPCVTVPDDPHRWTKRTTANRIQSGSWNEGSSCLWLIWLGLYSP